MPRELVRGIAHIHEALNCGLPIDPQLFKIHCSKVKDMFHAINDWVQMWPAFHKVNTVLELSTGLKSSNIGQFFNQLGPNFLDLCNLADGLP